MVFGNEYDKSLWLLIVKNVVNQKYIAEMINNIPYEIWDEIRLLIDDSAKGISREKLQFSSGNFEYIVNIVDGELSVKVIDSDEEYKDMIEWSFVPLNMEQINELKYFTPIHLGQCIETLSFGEQGKGTYLEEYELVKTPMGSYVRTFRNNDKGAVSTKMVNIKNIPNDIYVHQFANEQRINRLVKRKKRKQ